MSEPGLWELLGNRELSTMQFLALKVMAENRPMTRYDAYRAVAELVRTNQVLPHVAQASMYKSLDGMALRGLIEQTGTDMGSTGREVTIFAITETGQRVVQLEGERQKALASLWEVELCR